ncbi:hypothetical protein IG631_22817 [Alternaria alternata]|nr:hypothetical protein IG631_22817 [Alternaria alternata]
MVMMATRLSTGRQSTYFRPPSHSCVRSHSRCLAQRHTAAKSIPEPHAEPHGTCKVCEGFALSGANCSPIGCTFRLNGNPRLSAVGKARQQDLDDFGQY